MEKGKSGNYLKIAAEDLECHICGDTIPKGMTYRFVDGKNRHTVCHDRKLREMAIKM